MDMHETVVARADRACAVATVREAFVGAARGERIARLMAEEFLRGLSLDAATTRDDLLRAGFTPDEIDAHAGTAADLATRRAVKRLARTGCPA